MTYDNFRTFSEQCQCGYLSLDITCHSDCLNFNLLSYELCSSGPNGSLILQHKLNFNTAGLEA